MIALTFSLNTTLTLLSSNGYIIADVGFPEYLIFASTSRGSVSSSIDIKFISLARSSVLNISSSLPTTTVLLKGTISVTYTGVPRDNPNPFL